MRNVLVVLFVVFMSMNVSAKDMVSIDINWKRINKEISSVIDKQIDKVKEIDWNMVLNSIKKNCKKIIDKVESINEVEASNNVSRETINNTSI